MVMAQKKKKNYKAANVIEFSDYGATIVSELSLRSLRTAPPYREFVRVF